MTPAATARAGFTLVETLLVLAVLGVLIVLVAPSMREMMAAQRVRGINSELVTDLQFARSEAVRMNRPVLVSFENNSTQSCYTIFVRGVVGFCRCSYGAGSACRLGPTELRTVNVQRSRDVAITAVSSENTADFSFEPRQGLPSYPSFVVDVSSGVHGQLRTTVNSTGRLATCTPDGSISGVPRC